MNQKLVVTGLASGHLDPMKEGLTSLRFGYHLFDSDRLGVVQGGMARIERSVQPFIDQMDDILKTVDLEWYPIHDLEGEAGRGFLQRCREAMTAQGWCSLDRFIRPEAIDALAQESTDLLPQAEALTIKRNVYGADCDRSAPEGDPKRREYVHHALQLADDQISDTTLIKRLYHCYVVTEFVRRVQGKPRLYRYGDQFQALNIVALQPGNWHAWHYDHNECTVTLLLQAAEAGGDFTFFPNSRTREEDGRDIVEPFLAGDMTHAKSFERGAGTFTLFRGEFSLHGVTEVKGTRPRVSAIFTYDEQPGRSASDDINTRIYGPRAEQILTGQRSA